jgi:hypothetical protein
MKTLTIDDKKFYYTDFQLNIQMDTNHYTEIDYIQIQPSNSDIIEYLSKLQFLNIKLITVKYNNVYLSKCTFVSIPGCCMIWNDENRYDDEYFD